MINRSVYFYRLTRRAGYAEVSIRIYIARDEFAARTTLVHMRTGRESPSDHITGFISIMCS